MTEPRLRVVVLGLSITSSWGNGHATTYRALLREVAALGHSVLFLERDVPWYARERDMPEPPFCDTALYTSLRDLKDRFSSEVRDADMVIVGSYVPEGVAVGEWVTRTAGGVTAFYDIDTPVTLTKLDAGDEEYIAPHLIPAYQIYFSFTGGPVLDRLERTYGSPCARPLYCSFDASIYYPEPAEQQWDLAYMGTYSDDRQPTLDRLLTDTARRWGGGRFAVVGPQYPDHTYWPTNVERIEHLPPEGHRRFYCAQRFTLNVTRAAMIAAGHAPSVRLFEAAACGTPIISDTWDGLDTLFEPGTEILLPRSSRDVLEMLVDINERARRAIGARARERVLRQHTAAHRARELMAHVQSARSVVPAA
ncbi:MAG TPA: glycosyltransferase [Longimicrobiales bacterium]|nr:glycosyltransferase [Longimicrobiales bacterium]